MTSTEFKSALEAEPFRPFSLHFGSGRVVSIKNPGLVVVSDTGRTAIAYRPGSDGWDVIDFFLVERLAFTESQNGHRRKRRS